jgi:hypothetical protein
MRYELSETLTALVESLEPPADTGLVLREASLQVPLEVQTGHRGGALVFYAHVAHTRWRWGVLPPLHPSRLHVVADREAPGAA